MEPRPFDAIESASFMGQCLLSPPNGISPSGSCFRSWSTVLPPHEACQMGSGNPPDNVRRSPHLDHSTGHDLCYSFRGEGEGHLRNSHIWVSEAAECGEYAKLSDFYK